MEKQEFIRRAKERLAAYDAAEKRMNGEIIEMLNGQPETYTKEDGMTGFHAKFNEIKKIRHTLADVAHRKQQCTDALKEVE